MADAQKRKEQQKKLEEAKKIASQKGPLSKFFFLSICITYAVPNFKSFNCSWFG